MTSNMAPKLAIQTRAVSWLQSQKKLKIGTSQKSQIQSEMIQIFNLEHSHSGLKENLWFVYLQSRHIFCLFNITCSWIDCFYMHNLCSIMVADIIKIENLPTFSGQKTDKLIGFSVVGLAKNTLWVMNLSNFWLIFSTLKIEK